MVPETADYVRGCTPSGWPRGGRDLPPRRPDARETRLEGDSTKGRQTDSARLRRLAPHGEQNYSPCWACQATAEVAAARTVVLAMSRPVATWSRTISRVVRVGWRCLVSACPC